MNSKIDSKSNPAGERQEPDLSHSRGPVYLYKDSGIQEKHGHIPLWLKAVVVILFIWGVYYLVAFWSPPPS
ncbi:MAG: hypothetical protein WBQ69_12290 [Gallionella sp.]